MKKGIYPGSFDPITKGHIDVIEKALHLCDKLYVVVSINENKKHMFDIDTRAEIVQKAISQLKIPIGTSVEVIVFGGVISNLAKELDIDYMIRGIRDHIDLSYELNIEQFTKATVPEIITVYFTAESKNVYTSSSLIRQFIVTDNVDKIVDLIPEGTYELIKNSCVEKIDQKLSSNMEYKSLCTCSGAKLH